MCKNKYKILLIIGILILIMITMFFSCSKSPDSTPSSKSNTIRTKDVSFSESKKQESVGGNFASVQSEDKNTGDVLQSNDKKIITTGYIEGKVQSIEQTIKTLQDLCLKSKGYISTENTYKQGDRTTCNVTIRIPSDQYNDFMISVENLYIAIDNKSLSRSDVTEEYFDIETRLATKKAFQLRFLQILKQANTVEDILEVENQLRMIQEEIESSEGRLKYLDNQVSFSTLNAIFYMTNSNIKGNTFWDKLVKSLKTSIDMLVSLFLFIIKLWVFIIIALAVYLYLQRKNK